MSAERLTTTGLQQGDAASWEQLYQRPYHLIEMIVSRTGVPAEEMADVIQDGFLKVVRGVNSLRPSDNPIPWIVRVMQNTAIDHQRSQGRRPRPILLSEIVQHEDSTQEVEESVLSFMVDPGDMERQFLAQEALDEAVKQLMPREVVLFTRLAEGYKDNVIGPELGLLPQSVKTVRNRARERLRSI